MGKRCQVCDGPVVNGRCKYCGMPYRNDAVMYHLNEDRSEHYRHASEKVRKAMKENEIPLPDRTAKSTAKGKKYFQKHGAKYSKEVSFICRTVPGSCRDTDRTYLYRKNTDFSAEIFEACEKEQNIHDLLGGICRRSCFIFLCTGFPGCGQCD